MKKKVTSESEVNFVGKLINRCVHLRKLQAKEICIFNVIGNYGNYQIIIGPEYDKRTCKKLDLDPHSREIEINGSMHHLFVSHKRISATPHQDDIRTNLRGSVIMKDLIIHIIDEHGKGNKVKVEKIRHDGVYAKKKINLAGDKGESMVNRYKSTGKLANETYKIIQKDILKALK